WRAAGPERTGPAGAGHLLGYVAVERGAFLFEFHAVLQSRVADSTLRFSAHIVMRSVTACIRLDLIRHDYTRRSPGRALCETAVRYCHGAELDAAWDFGLRA